MWFGWILFGFGGLLCALNFYLSFLRFLFFRARGGRREDYRHISGFPGIGSATLAIAWLIWLRRLDSGPLDLAAALLFLIDTGGLHWFAGVMLLEWLRSRADGSSGPRAG
jgi:hypothetical protein